MDQAEDARDERLIGRVALELNELRLRAFDVLRRFREEVF
jgi:hypothetical protein